MSAVNVLPAANETSTKMMLKEKRQKRMTVQARIKYRQRIIKNFKTHLQNGTFPQRLKSIKPYPKMSSPESQAIVNAACDQMQCVILEQMIVEEEKQLTKDQDQYQVLLEQKRKVCKTRVKKPSVVQLLKELAELQEKYSHVCKTLENTRENYAQKMCEGLKTSPSDTVTPVK